MPAIASQATTFGSRSRVTVVLIVVVGLANGWSGWQVRQGYRRSALDSTRYLTRPRYRWTDRSTGCPRPVVREGNPDNYSRPRGPVAFLVTFGLILPAELPDKTFVATLVLSTRFRPRTVWFGVGAAFGVQTADRCRSRSGVSPAPPYSSPLVTAGLFAVGVTPDVPRGVRCRPGAEMAEQETALSPTSCEKLAGPSGSVSESSLPPSGETCHS